MIKHLSDADTELYKKQGAILIKNIFKPWIDLLRDGFEKMKKIFTIIILFIFFYNPAYGDKLLKNGFINKRLSYAKDQNIIDPSNTIIIIYNHGQEKHDIRLKNCSWKNNLRNSVSLLDTKVNGKQNPDLEELLNNFNSKSSRVFNKVKLKNFVNSFFSVYDG